MVYYILWNDHCVKGIYKNENIALKEWNKINKTKFKERDIEHTGTGFESKENIMLCCTKVISDKWICTQVQFMGDKIALADGPSGIARLYFLVISEKNGHNSLYVCKNKKVAIKLAQQSHDIEHDPNKECEYCENEDFCKEKLVRKLKENNEYKMPCVNDDIPYIKFKIFRMDIDQ